MKKNGKPHNAELKCLKCERPVRAKGLCASHYNLQYYTPVSAKPQHVGVLCDFPDCKVGTTRSDGLCTPHGSRRAKWGLDAARFIELASRKACDVCDALPGKASLAFDHDHNHCATGCGDCIRGVLCVNCNVALGYAQESATRLRKLADYIEKVK